jgi:competence protein ComGC
MQATLIVVAVVRVLIAVVHVPAISTTATVLTGTPPVAAVASIVESATGIAEATRNGRKTVSVQAQVTTA